ncbi:ATP-binding protein [Gemmatimonas phototrophica]|uniref:ATP-binding protein n=1 Tax=Gemmatimonas phototrophica TaxID=1379270 RepID=UPI0006A6A3AB|nr:ATP-binding protein [Gemmatimonas phototrophica]
MMSVVPVPVMLAYLLVYLGATLLSLVFPGMGPVLAIGFIPIGLVAIFTMWHAGRAATSMRERLAWQLLASGEACFWVGGQIWTWAMINDRPFPLDSAFDVVSSALVVTGLLCFPRTAPPWWRDRRAILDSLLLAVAVSAMVWLFLVQPIREIRGEVPADLWILLLVTAPELMVVAWVYLRVGNAALRASIGLWLGAAALSASADYLWEALSPRYLPGTWVDAPWFLAWGLRWYAAHLALSQYASTEMEPRNEGARGITPAAFVAGTYISLVAAAVLGRTDSVRLLGFVAVTMTVLLLIRQRMELHYTEDLTKQAASQLRRFRALLAQATDFVFVIDTQFRVAFLGPAVERAQLLRIGDGFLSLFQDMEHEQIRSWLDSTTGPPGPLRCRLRAAPGNTVELRKQDRRDDPHIRGWVVVGRDRSMELALEQRVRHSEKLAALHDMAGRVAHAYNNLLSSVIGRAELLGEALPVTSPLRNDVTSIHSAAAKGAAITRQLLGFSDAHVARTVLVDGAQVLSDLVPVLLRLLPGGITLDVSHRETGALVRVEVSQFEQVITNLVTNARDAMPDGGVVRIAWRREGPMARLEVTDTGCGMTPEVQARVFDPFFTTKPTGRGTGLGLAMVAAMVQRAGGQVSIDSTPEVGTRVTVQLPLADEVVDTAPERRTPTVAAPATPSAHTILLVDDDREVRQVSARILRRAGFQVIDVENATNALALLADQSVPLDLLLTDMMMPGISGRELVTLSRGLRPTLPIICVTGFVAAGDGSDEWLKDVNAVVEKPFSTASLTGAVRSALGRSGG